MKMRLVTFTPLLYTTRCYAITEYKIPNCTKKKREKESKDIVDKINKLFEINTISIVIFQHFWRWLLVD